MRATLQVYSYSSCSQEGHHQHLTLKRVSIFGSACNFWSTGVGGGRTVNGCLSTWYVASSFGLTWWLRDDTGDHGSDGPRRLVVPTTTFIVAWHVHVIERLGR